jgi:cbb3-type cytochrome oxidase maturation protein
LDLSHDSTIRRRLIASCFSDAEEPMSILMMLAPMSVFLGLLGVGAFWWTLRNRQYEDPAGDAARILIDDPEDRPL